MRKCNRRRTEEALKDAQKETAEVEKRDRDITKLDKTLSHNEDAFVDELERVFHRIGRND